MADHMLNRTRLWGMRISAILLGLLPFLALEASLRWLGWPKLQPPADPFVDLHNLRPLFVPDPSNGKMQIGEERMNLFRPAAFDAVKDSTTFRIFALGASTTQGEPYSTETAFPFWLELNLEAAHGESKRRFEVINCGGLSYASYRVLAILREVLDYQPDLIVIYTGHNEFLESRTYQGYHERSFRNRSMGWLTGLRTVQLVRTLAGQRTERQLSVIDDTQDKATDTGPSAVSNNSEVSERGLERTVLAAEVDALLDYQGGLAEYRRGDAWYQPIPDHFRWNLEQMCEACQRAGVPVLVVRPVSNILDCPPMKFEPAPLLSEQQLRQFATEWEAARRPANSPVVAAQHLHAALQIDPQHAGANYLLGLLQFEQGDFEAAKNSLIRARDFDVCPLRATTDILTAVSETTADFRVPMLDAEELFAARSEQGIVGQRWLVDHIHPSVEGHQLLGEAIAERCFELGILPQPVEGWQTARRQLYSRHLNSLNEAYFHRGKQRLEGLLRWTQGRAKKVRELAPSKP
jgi:lysophospholipase L1-like esterase